MSKKEGKIKTLIHNVANSLDLQCKLEDIFIEQSKSLGLIEGSYKYAITIECEGQSYTVKGSMSGLIQGRENGELIWEK